MRQKNHYDESIALINYYIPGCDHMSRFACDQFDKHCKNEDVQIYKYS